MREHPVAGWFICLPHNLGHSFLLGLHPGLQDTVSSTNVGDIMAFFCLEVDRIFPDAGVRGDAGENGSTPGPSTEGSGFCFIAQ